MELSRQYNICNVLIMREGEGLPFYELCLSPNGLLNVCIFFHNWNICVNIKKQPIALLYLFIAKIRETGYIEIKNYEKNSKYRKP